MTQIGLMDCNNFFVSCERLFRPDLLKKPVLVLSSNDGCVVARSQEVKDLGIPMGAPYFQVKALCNKENITVFSSNFVLYRDISRRVMHALKEVFDACEIYSIDEAFFVVPDGMTADEIAAKRSFILQMTGIPVSIGIATTKTRAKCAASAAKRGSGVCVLTEALFLRIAKETPCGAVWGIGRQTAAKLSADGVSTVAEFLAVDPAYIRKKYGVMGERLRMELMGTSVNPVRAGEVHIPESIMSSRSFNETRVSFEVLKRSLSRHAVAVAEKLRRGGLVATTLSVSAAPSRFGDFAYRKYSNTVTLREPTSSTTLLLREAEALLRSFYDASVPYTKTGLRVGGIYPETYASTSLFESTRSLHAQEIDAVSDGVNTALGAGAVVRGSVYGRSTNPSKQFISAEYTTRWGDIPTVRAF